MMSYPILYAVLAEATGDYGLGFYLAALPAVLMAFKLYKPAKQVKGMAA